MNHQKTKTSKKKKIKESKRYLSIDLDDEAVESEDEFEIISQEEEAQLKAIKLQLKNLQKLSPPSKKRRKRISQRRIHRTIPIRKKVIKSSDFNCEWPIDLSQFWLSSLYGPRKRPNGNIEFHYALDMAALKGTPVRAACSGKVSLAQTISGYGNCILLEHNHCYKTRYAHLHTIQVRCGEIVEQGQIIGTVGDTGLVRKSGRDASHLHFEVYQNGHRVNPLQFLV